MTRILDTKARCDDFAAARDVLRDAGATHERTLDQTDTYFTAAHGWLKLRETCVHGSDRVTADLIAYRRSGERDVGECTFSVLPVDDADSWRAALSDVLGVVVDVHKTREVWCWETTEVHLDDVTGLGLFVELETGADGDEHAADAHRQRATALGVDHGSAVGGSYSDLLLTTPHDSD